MLILAGCAKDVPNKYGVTPVYEAVLKGELLLYEFKKGLCVAFTSAVGCLLTNVTITAEEDIKCVFDEI